jgi:hypothetical protein
LASHGNEGPREEKFRGALIAQASKPTTIDRASVQLELDTLLLEKPDYGPAAIAMAIGGAFGIAGAAFLMIMTALPGGSLIRIAMLAVGLGFLPAGAIVVLAAGLAMITVWADRRVFDERIRVLQEKLAGPPSAPTSLLVLARF